MIGTKFIRTYSTISGVQLTVISCEVLYEATIANYFLYRTNFLASKLQFPLDIHVLFQHIMTVSKPGWQKMDLFLKAR